MKKNNIDIDKNDIDENENNNEFINFQNEEIILNCLYYIDNVNLKEKFFSNIIVNPNISKYINFENIKVIDISLFNDIDEFFYYIQQIPFSKLMIKNLDIHHKNSYFYQMFEKMFIYHRFKTITIEKLFILELEKEDLKLLTNNLIFNY